MIELDSSAYPSSDFAGSAPQPIQVERRPIRLRLASAQPVAIGNDLVVRRPTSGMFLAFAVALASVALVATGFTDTVQSSLQSAGLLPTNTGDQLTTRLGIVGSAVLVLAAMVVAYRSAVTRSPAMAPIALVVLGPAAWWNWGLFANPQPSSVASSSVAIWLVLAGAVAVALSLILEANHTPRWLGLYCGLGATGVAFTAATVGLRSSTDNSIALPVLMILAGLACLYGAMVEGEAVRRQLSDELFRVRAMAKSYEPEMVGVELHDPLVGVRPINVPSQPDLELLATLVPDPADTLPKQPLHPDLDSNLDSNLDLVFGPVSREPWTWPEEEVARLTPPLPPPSMMLDKSSHQMADQPGLFNLYEAAGVCENSARETAEMILPIVPLSLWPDGESPWPDPD